jgi:carbamoyltransferase
MVPQGSGGYRRLIEAFFELTGLPLILNTSLNIRGEPMVETPAQAVECFLGTNLDLLYLGGHRVEKPRLDVAAPDSALIPTPNAGVALDPGQASWRRGSWSHSPPRASIRTGHRFELEAMEAALLPRVDGETTVGQLVAEGDGAAKLDALVSLQRRGLIAMKAADQRR